MMALSATKLLTLGPPRNTSLQFKLAIDEGVPMKFFMATAANPPPDNFQKTAPGPGGRDKQATAYRERLHQLNNELETIDKKISQLRNFKGDNTSASGGINMNHGYSMTPVEDQVKQLEEKKKQIQAQIDAVEDQARKNGFEPGQLRQ
jgi:hypothetical protein